MRDGGLVLAIAVGAAWAWSVKKRWLAGYLAAICIAELVVGLR